MRPPRRTVGSTTMASRFCCLPGRGRNLLPRWERLTRSGCCGMSPLLRPGRALRTKQSGRRGSSSFTAARTEWPRPRLPSFRSEGSAAVRRPLLSIVTPEPSLQSSRRRRLRTVPNPLRRSFPSRNCRLCRVRRRAVRQPDVATRRDRDDHYCQAGRERPKRLPPLSELRGT